MSQQELVAKAKQMFDVVRADVGSLVAALEELDNDKDKTLTRRPTDQDALRITALRRKVKDVKELAKQADQGRGGGTSCFEPAQHRQLAQFAASFHAYKRHKADKTPDKIIQPHQALAHNLRRGMNIENECPPPWANETRPDRAQDTDLSVLRPECPRSRELAFPQSPV